MFALVMVNGEVGGLYRVSYRIGASPTRELQADWEWARAQLTDRLGPDGLPEPYETDAVIQQLAERGWRLVPLGWTVLED